MNNITTQVDKTIDDTNEHRDDISSSLVFGNDIGTQDIQYNDNENDTLVNDTLELQQQQQQQQQQSNDNLKDTQVISKSAVVVQDTQIIPKINDTRVISKINENDTQIIPKLELDDTQVIPKDTEISKRQVINTQEQSGIIQEDEEEEEEEEEEEDPQNKESLNDDIIDNTKDLEIRSDEEIEEIEDFKYGYDDSLLTHQIKHKKTQQKILTKGKIDLRRGNTVGLGKISMSSKPLLKRNYSVPLVLASSSPQQQMNQDQYSGDEKLDHEKGDLTIDTTVAGQLIPPSSPENENNDHNISKDFSLGASEIDEPEITNNDLDNELGTTSNLEVLTSKKVISNNDDLEVLTPKQTQDNNIAPTPEQTQDDSGSEVEVVVLKKRRLNNIIESQTSPTPILREETSDIFTFKDIKNRNSVWASYNLKMYTGKLITKFHDYSTIEFHEGNYEIKNQDLFLLDIRIGDTLHIKSNITTKYIVTGLSRENQDSIPCIRGYNTVYLKTTRRTSKEVKKSLSECFMELSDWVIHQQKYKIIDETETIQSTPKKLTRTETNELISPNKKLNLRDESQTLNGKLFCITNVDNERKNYIKSLIESNGGLVIEKELYEMFQFCKYQTWYLEGLEFFNNIDFAAILSNNYCRSPKYLQGLALGWPIISDSFIIDVIKNGQLFNNWPCYLLPSGESKDLNCVKSLDIFQFKLNYDKGFKLSHQLKNNNHLLNNYRILIINSRKNNESLETCKFIFYCFGAIDLTFINEVEIQENLKLMKSGSNVLIYENDGYSAEEKLKKLTKRKKGKRVNLRFVNWEWVVQCVISGYIRDDRPMLTINV
ncbi:unnamed protein product [Candida verbasci]|uniref:BRCT domain-containing protein n=1 Tax=Candida verbasci TaxID=1227364 RepID=A0A9W4U0C9_9ASCO|nr:unnamed protein product [Candida verbasci]